MEKTILELASSLGGFAGLVCAALIYYLGREVRDLRAAIDRITRMELMRLIASPHVSPDVKTQLVDQLREVEDAQKTKP